MMHSRREFCRDCFKISAGAGLAAALAPMATGRAARAHNKITVGVVGCKGMGFSNLKHFLNHANVECAALADVDRNVLDQRIVDVAGIHEDKVRKGHQVTRSKPLAFSDYRQLLDQRDIDAVICGTPDHWHTLIGIHALEAGKHLYIEKPMANSLGEALLIEKAAQRYKRTVQVGQWQRSDRHWLDAVAYVRSGTLGSIRLVKTWAYLNWFTVKRSQDTAIPESVDYDFWLGPAPSESTFNPGRFHFSWRWWWNYGGGLMTDWGVHMIDFALAGMQAGAPRSVASSGGIYSCDKQAMQTPDTQQTVYEFDGFNLMWEHAIGINKGPFNREHGVAFIGDNGTLVVDRGGWEVIPITENRDYNFRIKPVARTAGDGQGLANHVRNFLDCVKAGRLDANANPRIGREVAVVSHMGNVALRTGKKLHWDADRNRFTDDDANAMILPTYRAPWVLPKV